MTLGERIAYYRKKAGYSQEGLAEQLNVSRQAISKWETGEATPDAERIIALAAVLGISTDTLLLGKEEPERPYTEAETVRQPAPTPEWLDHLPRHIGRLFREKGYIAGYIVAAQGLGILLVGAAGALRLWQYSFHAEQHVGHDGICGQHGQHVRRVPVPDHLCQYPLYPRRHHYHRWGGAGNYLEAAGAKITLK